MKRGDRAQDPAPAVGFNREAKTTAVCARMGCTEVVGPKRKFCSSECFGISRRKPRPIEHEPLTRAQVDEMQRALDALREAIDE